MAQKKKTSSKSATTKSATKVTRIKATDARTSTDKKTDTTNKSRKTAAPKTKSVVKAEKVTTEPKRKNLIIRLLGYFKGAWEELGQVRWPNRRTTWGLTLAVILFTVFFVVLIVLLDFGFQWIFDQILG